MLGVVGNRFTFDVHNWTSWTLPGTSITPGNNSFPAYAPILAAASVTRDCYGIQILLGNNAVTAAVRDTLVNIGIDPAGGTTYETRVPNLLATHGWGAGPGHCYYFPLYIPAGSSLAAQASVNNGTVGTLRVGVRLFGAPTHPELLRAGSYVTSFGEVAASSRGTTVTPGASNAEAAAWVQLGANLTREHWWWQLGLGSSDSDLQSGAYMLDLAAGTSVSSNDIIIRDDFYCALSSEAFRRELLQPSYYADVAAGLGVYGRASWSGATLDTGMSMIAYGVGG